MNSFQGAPAHHGSGRISSDSGAASIASSNGSSTSSSSSYPSFRGFTLKVPRRWYNSGLGGAIVPSIVRGFGSIPCASLPCAYLMPEAFFETFEYEEEASASVSPSPTGAASVLSSMLGVASSSSAPSSSSSSSSSLSGDLTRRLSSASSAAARCPLTSASNLHHATSRCASSFGGLVGLSGGPSAPSFPPAPASSFKAPAHYPPSYVKFVMPHQIGISTYVVPTAVEAVEPPRGEAHPQASVVQEAKNRQGEELMDGADGSAAPLERSQTYVERIKVQRITSAANFKHDKPDAFSQYFTLRDAPKVVALKAEYADPILTGSRIPNFSQKKSLKQAMKTAGLNHLQTRLQGRKLDLLPIVRVKVIDRKFYTKPTPEIDVDHALEKASAAHKSSLPLIKNYFDSTLNQLEKLQSEGYDCYTDRLMVAAAELIASMSKVDGQQELPAILTRLRTSGEGADRVTLECVEKVEEKLKEKKAKGLEVDEVIHEAIRRLKKSLLERPKRVKLGQEKQKQQTYESLVELPVNVAA
eukprot:GHVT01031880.1.p1 GENE.GHVT01031880.1~~GHVT01031880.1.p1  ORF type:complete len:528 (-),score=153.23 GHVT01031880.1:236-1819(-)